MSEWKFPIGSSVKHLKTGNTYGIVGKGNLEADMTEVYVYGNSYSKLWIRDKSPMEDGRFELIENKEQE